MVLQCSTVFHPEPGSTKAQTEKSLHEFGEKFEQCVKSGAIPPGPASRKWTQPNDEMPLERFIRYYYYPLIEKKLSPNTVRFYHLVCAQFLIPSFGRFRLCDINHHYLQQFIDYLAYSTPRKDRRGECGLSPGSVKRYSTVFRSVLTEACRCNFLDHNPFRCDSIFYPKRAPQTLEVYTADEAAAFAKALESEPTMLHAVLLTALLTGLRRAEIAALTWEDVDLDARSIRVNKSAYKSKGKPQDLKAPKSLHGYRTVFFPDRLGEIFKTWKKEQEKQREAVGKNWQEGNFDFTGKSGKMISIYSLTDLCSAFEKRHGFRHLKLHGLRHTCGSLLMAAGTDAETMRDILGHDSVRTTDIYLHPYEGKKRKAAGRMEAILGGNFETQNRQCDNPAVS